MLASQVYAYSCAAQHMFDMLCGSCLLVEDQCPFFNLRSGCECFMLCMAEVDKVVLCIVQDLANYCKLGPRLHFCCRPASHVVYVLVFPGWRLWTHGTYSMRLQSVSSQ